MVNIAQNVKDIKRYISEREKALGREIILVGATKTRTAAEINAAVAAGLSVVGENRPQELRDKLSLISPSAEIHFIGHLQKNKIKYVVGKASLIHSCDSLDLAAAVSAYAKERGITQDMLIEVNISGEADKHGFSASEIFAAAEKLKTLDNVRFTGLMTVLPHIGDVSAHCDETRKLYEKLQSEVFGGQFRFLSMGMSEDYKTAIEFGSNMVRIGRGIFGERDYGKD